MRTLGEVVYIYPEEVYIIVVMVNEKGIRYIDPDNLEFDEDGYIRTRYVAHDTMNERSSVSHGTIKDLAEIFRFIAQKFGTSS